jgi:spore coat-associated protein N
VRWTLLAMAAVVALAALSGAAPGGEAQPRVELVDGELSLQNSHEGQAIIGAEDVAPGDSATGTVTLSNTGSLAGTLSLSASELSDTPGPGGGPLSAQLQLVVEDLSAGSTVYNGPLTSLGTLALGALGPGAAKPYRLTTSLPASADNSVAGASMSVAYTWTAEEAPPVDPPPPPPVEPPVGPPPPGSTTGLRESLRVRVRVPRAQPLIGRGRLIAYVRCDRACRVEGRARLAAGRGRGVRTALARSGQVRAGRDTRLILRLPKKKVKRLLPSLRKSGRASIEVTVTARSGQGARSTVRKRARIAAVPAGRRR